MDRREFLQYLSIGAVCMAGSSIISGCGSSVNEIRRQVPTAGNKLNSLESDILYLASLAPSGHNAQPWRVLIIDNKTWVIGLDTTRMLSAVDPDNREAWISIGAFCENLSVAARKNGFDVQFIENTDTAFPVRLVFNESRQTDSRCLYISSRRCTRKGLSDTVIKSTDARNILSGIEDHFVFIPRDNPSWSLLNDMTIEANRMQSMNDDKQKELSDWIRWSDSEIKKHRDGLTPAGMGITGIAGLYVNWFYNKNTVLSQDFRDKSVDLVREQVQAGGGWIALKSDGSSWWDYFQAGRRFERLFLNLEERKIGLHPMNQVIEESSIRPELNGVISGGDNIVMLCRLGYVEEYAKPVTPRRPVDWFTNKKAMYEKR